MPAPQIAALIPTLDTPKATAAAVESLAGYPDLEITLAAPKWLAWAEDLAAERHLKHLPLEEALAHGLVIDRWFAGVRAVEAYLLLDSDARVVDHAGLDAMREALRAGAAVAVPEPPIEAFPLAKVSTPQFWGYPGVEWVARSPIYVLMLRSCELVDGAMRAQGAGCQVREGRPHLYFDTMGAALHMIERGGGRVAVVGSEAFEHDGSLSWMPGRYAELYR